MCMIHVYALQVGTHTTWYSTILLFSSRRCRVSYISLQLCNVDSFYKMLMFYMMLIF